MNKIEQLIGLYKDINYEICQLIGNGTIDLVERNSMGEEEHFTYHIDADQYNVVSVNVNKYCNTDMDITEKVFLHFKVNLISVNADGSIEEIETEHTLQDIPFEYVIELLKYVYNKIPKKEDKYAYCRDLYCDTCMNKPCTRENK